MFGASHTSRASWLLLLAAAIAALLLWGLVMAQRYGREGVSEQFSRDQLRQTQLIASQIEEHLSGLETSLSKLASLLDEDKPTHLQADLQLIASGQPDNLLDALYVRDDEGNILAASAPGELASGSLPIHLLGTPAQAETGGRLIWTPEPSILLSQRPPSGKNLELIAVVSLDHLAIELATGPFSSEQFLLMNSSGRFLLHPDEALHGLDHQDLIRQTADEELQAVYTAMARGDTLTSLLQNDSFGPDEVMLSIAPFNFAGHRWNFGRLAATDGLAALDLTHRLAAALLVCVVGGGLLLVLFQLTSQRKSHELTALNHQREASIAALESSLLEARRRSRQLLEFASDAMFFIDPDSGMIVDQNQTTCDLIGYSATEIKDLRLTRLFPGHQKRRYQKLVREVMKNGYGEERDLLFRRKDGSLFTGSVNARLGTLDQERIVHGSLRDISPLKQIEIELRRKNRDLALLNRLAHRAAATDNMQDMMNGILEMVVEALDADCGGIFISRHAGNDLHLAADCNIPEEVANELQHLKPGQGLAGLVASSGQPRSSVDLQKDRRRWSTSVLNAGWHAFQAVPLATGDRVVGVLFISCLKKRVFKRDDVRLLVAIGKQVGSTIEGAELFDALRWQNRLTQASNRELEVSRQRLKENLRRQEEATRTLERMELMKNNFLALASHELRTPLTYILSGTELLLDQTDEQASQRQILTAVRQGGERLQEIVDNLLEVARLEAQSIYLGRERVDLDQLLSPLEQDLKERIAQSRLTLTIHPPNEEIELFGDPDHLYNALLRVVENAVKFTRPGGAIQVECQRISSDQLIRLKPRLAPFTSSFFDHPLAAGYLQISVSDSGIGIDPDEQSRIFDKFYEVGDIIDHHTSQSRFGGKGVGLGLTLVRGMIEAHNGMIWVSSEGTDGGGKGSQFHLLLPEGKGDADVRPEAALA